VPPVIIADFVCGGPTFAKAIGQSKKDLRWTKGPSLRPSARDMALRSDTLVFTEPSKALPSRDR